MALVELKRGFFVVRKGGRSVVDLGARWPNGATFAPDRTKAALVFGRDAAPTFHATTFEDAAVRGLRAVEEGKELACYVGKCVGKYGASNLYERVLVATTRDAAKADALKAWDPFASRAELVRAKQLAGAPDGTRIKQVGGALVTKGAKIAGWLSKYEVDRDREIVEPDAFNASIPDFMKNPIMLFNHDDDFPIGKFFSVAPRSNEGVWCEGSVADQWARDLVEQGVLQSFSARFRVAPDGIEFEEVDEENDPVEAAPAEPDDCMPEELYYGAGPSLAVATKRIYLLGRITKAALLEGSVVSIPCNRSTQFTVQKKLRPKGGAGEWRTKALAFHVAAPEQLAEGVVEYRRTPVADHAKTVAFDRDATRALLGREGVALAGALLHEDAADTLAHHGVQGEALVLDAPALRAATARLLGSAELGKAIDARARRDAYDHLAAHYADLGEAPPAYADEVAPQAVGAALAKHLGEVSILKQQLDRAQAQAWLAARGLDGCGFEVAANGAGTTIKLARALAGPHATCAIDADTCGVVYYAAEDPSMTTRAKGDGAAAGGAATQTDPAASGGTAAAAAPPPAKPAGDPAPVAGANGAEDASQEEVAFSAEDLVTARNIVERAQAGEQVTPEEVAAARSVIERATATLS